MMNEYDKRQAYLYGNQIMLEEERRLGVEEGFKIGIEKGIEKGIEEGKKEQQIYIARNLKKSGIDIKIISENTGLDIEEIEQL